MLRAALSRRWWRQAALLALQVRAGQLVPLPLFGAVLPLISPRYLNPCAVRRPVVKKAVWWGQHVQHSQRHGCQCWQRCLGSGNQPLRRRPHREASMCGDPSFRVLAAGSSSSSLGGLGLWSTYMDFLAGYLYSGFVSLITLVIVIVFPYY